LTARAARCGGKVIALFAWVPLPISGFYIVKSATRLINSVNIHIKNPDAVWIYAYSLFTPRDRLFDSLIDCFFKLRCHVARAPQMGAASSCPLGASLARTTRFTPFRVSAAGRRALASLGAALVAAFLLHWVRSRGRAAQKFTAKAKPPLQCSSTAQNHAHEGPSTGLAASQLRRRKLVRDLEWAWRSPGIFSAAAACPGLSDSACAAVAEAPGCQRWLA
jgi:hypothetical protein